MADIDLDRKAISCPMPIVRIAKAVKTMSPGQTLEVEATDPSFQADVEAWTRRTAMIFIHSERRHLCCDPNQG